MMLYETEKRLGSPHNLTPPYLSAHVCAVTRWYLNIYFGRCVFLHPCYISVKYMNANGKEKGLKEGSKPGV